MLQCVRRVLQSEIKRCRTCKTNHAKLKKVNKIFPELIVDLIHSFNVCKICFKTQELIKKNEPDELKLKRLTHGILLN